MFDKLKFWKKNDEFADLDRDLGLDTSDANLGLPDNKFDPKEMGQAPSFEDDIPSFDKSRYQLQPEPGQMQQQQQPPMQQMQSQSNQMNNAHQDVLRKDLEVISVKLDAIRSSIESINHRLSAMEKSNDKRW